MTIGNHAKGISAETMARMFKAKLVSSQGEVLIESNELPFETLEDAQAKFEGSLRAASPVLDLAIQFEVMKVETCEIISEERMFAN